MPDPQQLPALLRLLDDESVVVRDAVLTELAAYGLELENELRALSEPPGDALIAGILLDVSEHVHMRELASVAESEAGAGGPFELGQLVRHLRYGYRGVVVGRDDRCQAPDAWYQANRTQPERDQPWYHVLVHDTSQVTYAAASSLDADESVAEVNHPLVPLFFSGMQDGHYIRNDREWPPPET